MRLGANGVGWYLYFQIKKNNIINIEVGSSFYIYCADAATAIHIKIFAVILALSLYKLEMNVNILQRLLIRGKTFKRFTEYFYFSFLAHYFHFVIFVIRFVHSNIVDISSSSSVSENGVKYISLFMFI